MPGPPTWQVGEFDVLSTPPEDPSREASDNTSDASGAPPLPTGPGLVVDPPSRRDCVRPGGYDGKSAVDPSAHSPAPRPEPTTLIGGWLEPPSAGADRVVRPPHAATTSARNTDAAMSPQLCLTAVDYQCATRRISDGELFCCLPRNMDRLASSHRHRLGGTPHERSRACLASSRAS